MSVSQKEELDVLFFIWIHKSVFAKIILKLDALGLEYIENLSWIKLNANLIEGHEKDTNLQ